MTRYFVFATEERQESEEYRMEEPPEDNKMQSDPVSVEASNAPGPSTSSTPPPKTEEIDPELAEWLHVDEPQGPSMEDDSATESDDDSVNADVEGDDMDDWLKVEGADGDAEATLGEESNAKVLTLPCRYS